MSVEAIKKFWEKITNYDSHVDFYKKKGMALSMPSVAYVQLALHYLNEGERELAEETLQYSVDMGNSPEAYINLGVMKASEHNFDEAKKYFLKALFLDKNNSKAFCFLANVESEMKDFENAEKTYREALALDPQNKDIMLNYGITLMRQKKFQEAEKMLKKSCFSTELNINATYFLGLIALELNNTKEALEYFEIITNADPNNADALYYIAYIYYKQKEYDKCIEIAKKSFEYCPQRVEASMLIGESYMHLENKEDSLAQYEKAKAFGEKHFFFLISWGLTLQHFKEHSKADEKFQNAIDIEPQENIAYTYKGINLIDSGNYDEALQYLEKSLSLDDSEYETVYNIGEVYRLKKDYEKAEKYFLQSLDMSAQNIKAYGKTAYCKYCLKDYEQANKYFEKAIEYENENITNYLEYSKCLMEQKDFEKALKKLKYALNLDLDNIECLNLLFYANYALAKEKSSDYNKEKAIEIAHEIINKAPDKFVYRSELESIAPNVNIQQQ